MSELEIFHNVLFLLLGIIFGSFANVVIYRLPKNESVIRPGSHCPTCAAPIRWYCNIPIVSYVFLGGRCLACKTKISVRYPLVEGLMGLLFWRAYFDYGVSFDLVEILIFIFGLVAVSFIDLKHMILPDSFTLTGIVLGLVGSFWSSQRTIVESAVGVFIGGGLLWLIAYFYLAIKKQEGMGGGDIKLLAWIGAVLGVKALPFVILFASVTGSVAGIVAALRSNEGLRTAIPFGPFLSAGAIVFLFGGSAITQWYLDFVSLR